MPPDGVEAVGRAASRASTSRIDEELVTRKLPGVVGRASTGEGVDPAKWHVSPAQVEVTLTGALLAVEKAKAALAPVVKADARPTRRARESRTVDASRACRPGVGVRISPERVKVTPVQATSPLRRPVRATNEAR